MRTLYTCILPLGLCPVCGKTVKEAKKLGVEYQRKVVFFPRSSRKEVIRLTGQNRVPVLVEEDGTAMHESRDIVAYLRKTYGENTAATK